MVQKSLNKRTYYTGYNGQPNLIGAGRAEEEDGHPSRIQLVGDREAGDSPAHQGLRNHEKFRFQEQDDPGRRNGAWQEGEQGGGEALPRALEVVVDANILFSALIKRGYLFDFILHCPFRLYTPAFVFMEIQKHILTIARKSDMSPAEADQTLNVLMRSLIVLPATEADVCREEALLITPDINDIHYLSLALKLQCPLWSEDRALKKQKRVKVYTTQEVLRILGLAKSD